MLFRSLPVNRWIIGEVVETLAKMDQALADLRFDETANAIYQFTWATFCDWYVELVKGGFDDETRAVAGWAFDQILVMLHPLMPFITEELWHAMGKRKRDLIVAKWPAPETTSDAAASAEIRTLINIISAIRSQRLDTGFSPADVIPISPMRGSPATLGVMNKYKSTIGRMARVKPAKIKITGYDGGASWLIGGVDRYEFTDADETSIVCAQFIIGDVSVLANTDGFIDIPAERLRMSKLIQAAAKDRDGLAARLANPAFTERAKPEAVEKARADHDARAAEAERLGAALARLG